MQNTTYKNLGEQMPNRITKRSINAADCRVFIFVVENYTKSDKIVLNV